MQNFIPLKVLNFFLENPYQEIYLRELARKQKLSVFAIKKYADLLVKEQLILEEKKANLRYFTGNVNNLFFKHLKISLNLYNIQKSGLINFLKENLANVTSMILFGSMAKGENNINSDIDILIIGKQKHLDLKNLKDKLDRDISLHIFSWSEWNKKAGKDKAFYFDVIGPGIPLYGELPIVK